MMLKKIFSFLSVLTVGTALAAPTSPPTKIDFAADFKGTDGCFILYDLNTKKIVERYNPTRCAQRVAPNSTFKVPLSIMAFDQHLITQQTVFKWDGKKRALADWNQNQTPKTWLTYSALWVSQEITPQLGLPTIQKYLKEFNYGNQDFSGNPGKNDGLTQAWLSSSLKISADEQLAFLERLVTDTLPVSKQAMDNTKVNMIQDPMPTGWTVYGRSGSGHRMANGQSYPEGLYEGFIQKQGQTYIFVINLTDTRPSDALGGYQARAIFQTVMAQEGFY